MNIIPIINANDAVAPPPEADKDLSGVSSYTLFHGSVDVMSVLVSYILPIKKVHCIAWSFHWSGYTSFSMLKTLLRG